MSRHINSVILRQEFAKIYPALKPDDIFIENYLMIINELQIVRETELLKQNIALLRIKDDK